MATPDYITRHRQERNPEAQAIVAMNPPTEEELAKVIRNEKGQFVKGCKYPQSWKDASHASAKRKVKLKDMIFEELREQIQKEGFEGTYYREFLEKYMQAALKNTSGPEAAVIAKTILPDDILEKLDADVDKNTARDTDFTRYRIQQTLYGAQKAVFNDMDKRRIVVITSRRWGKSILNSRLIAGTAAIPNSEIFYINLTFQNAIDQLWEPTIETLHTADLIFKETSSSGLIEVNNGSVIHFKGNATKADTEKMRGYKARLVIVDEIQSQRNLKPLIEDVIEPLLMDYPDSRLILTGTPSRIPNTYAEELFKQYRDFPTATTAAYTGTILDNPYIPNVEHELDLICERKGVTRENSLIQREYLGVIGAYDTEARVFTNVRTFETTSKAPDYSNDLSKSFIPERIYIGTDYGFEDKNSIIGLAVNNTEKKVYIFYEDQFNKATVSEIIDSVKKCVEIGKKLLMRNPNAIMDDIRIFCDTNEKSITYEMSQTYHLPAYNCWKYDKSLAISQLKEDLASGRFQVPKDGVIEDESKHILYERDKDTDAITNNIDDKVFHPEAIMALLYASRQVYFDWGLDAGGEGKEIG